MISPTIYSFFDSLVNSTVLEKKIWWSKADEFIRYILLLSDHSFIDKVINNYLHRM